MNKIQIYREKVLIEYLRSLREIEQALLDSPKKISLELIDKMSNLLYMDATPVCDVCSYSCRQDDTLQPHCYMASLATTSVRHFLHLYSITYDQKTARKQILEQIPKVIVGLMEVQAQVMAQFGVENETV